MLNRTIYTGLSYLLAPIAVARLHYLSRKHSGYRERIGQRFGYHNNDETLTSDSNSKVLWLHAVSVGEVIASEPFVNALLLRYPKLKICITTMTPTGADQVVRSFFDAIEDQRIQHRYAPYDLPGAIDRLITSLNPFALVIMETELWPNWIAKTFEKNLPCILINGRMSEKSARGYAKLGRLSLEMFRHIKCVSAQTEQDASRFRALGAENVLVTGNLKADFELGDNERVKAEELASLFGLKNREDVLIAASTHAGEDEIILDAFAGLLKEHPRIRLVLVPRHPDRSADISGLTSSKALGYRLRSQNLSLDDEHPVVICDQLGELRVLYGLADIAIMGGTLIDHGGHNPLEPAAWSCSLVAGPSQRNFDLAFDALEQANAMLRVEADAKSLEDTLSQLLNDRQTTRSKGEAALAYLQESRGSTEKNITLFSELTKL